VHTKSVLPNVGGRFFDALESSKNPNDSLGKQSECTELKAEQASLLWEMKFGYPKRTQKSVKKLKKPVDFRLEVC
jgi:hypothetical protein